MTHGILNVWKIIRTFKDVKHIDVNEHSLDFITQLADPVHESERY